ncbi:unnamed protein product [Scytosiphon promiscuus]
MAIPMFILTIYSIFLGYARDNVTFHLVMGLPHTNSFIETEYTLPAIFKLLPLILGLSLSLLLVYIYEFTYKISKSSVYNYFNQRIYYDQLLNNLIIRPVLKLGGALNAYTDNGLLRVLGSTGISRALINIPVLLIINILYLFIVFFLYIKYFYIIPATRGRKLYIILYTKCIINIFHTPEAGII